MKLLVGNGGALEVRDVGPVLQRLKARVGGPPIKFNRTEVMSDEAAREVLRVLLATRLYDNEVTR